MAEKRKFYGMKNDYMFHAVLQKNEEVLRNLLATLLEMDEADIVSCHIENPIELGKKIEGKDCILDVKIKLNDARIINIELQVYKQTYWTNRSLLYWARAFDILKSGQDYSMLLPTYHIGILDFTLFENMVVTMKKLSEDEKIRMQCEAREDYERCLLSEYSAGKREGTETTQKKLLHNLMESQKITEDEARKMLGI